MNRRWKIAAVIAAVVCASSAVVGTAEASTGPARVIQINPTYAKCPQNSVCLYQGGSGTGSKAILTGSPYAMWNLRDVYFRNGRGADDQVSSVYNRTPLTAVLYLDADGAGYYISVKPGTKMDFDTMGYSGFDDQVSSIKLVNP